MNKSNSVFLCETLAFEATRLLRDLVIFNETLPDAYCSDRADYIRTAREALEAYFSSVE